MGGAGGESRASGRAAAAREAGGRGRWRGTETEGRPAAGRGVPGCRRGSGEGDPRWAPRSGGRLLACLLPRGGSARAAASWPPPLSCFVQPAAVTCGRARQSSFRTAVPRDLDSGRRPQPSVQFQTPFPAHADMLLRPCCLPQVIAIRPLRRVTHTPGTLEDEDEDEDNDDIVMLEKKIRASSMPEQAHRVCVKEMKR